MTRDSDGGPSIRRRQALLALLAGLFAAGLGLGKIVRDCSLTCNVGFRLAPLAILAIVVAAVPLAALARRGERRWGYRRWQLGSLAAAALTLLAFRVLTFGLLHGQQAALEADRPPGPWLVAARWTYLAFFVWVGVLSALLGVNVFASMLRLFAPEERERGLAVLAPAFAVGGFAGSLLAERTASWLMAGRGWRYELVRDHLMIGMALCLALQMPLVYAIDRRRREDGTNGPAPASGLAQALVAALRHRLVARLLAVVVLGGIADTLLKYVFYWLVSVQVDYTHGRTLYFASFYSWLNGANLVLLALGTHRAVGRLGITLPLAALPLATAGGLLALIVHLAVTLMYGLRIVENSLRSVLYEPGLDRAFVRLPWADNESARALLRGLGPRLGEGLGALLVFGFAVSPGLELRAAAFVLLAVLLLWLGAVLALRAAIQAGTGVGT